MKLHNPTEIPVEDYGMNDKFYQVPAHATVEIQDEHAVKLMAHYTFLKNADVVETPVVEKKVAPKKVAKKGKK